MGQVIFTADDYGVNDGIDQGVIDAVQKGYINSVAAFSNHPQSTDRINRLIEETSDQEPSIGCHLTLTSGKPATKKVGWLTKKDGYFHGFTNHKFPKKGLTASQRQSVKEELWAQIDIMKSAGLPVEHLSSHHNVLYWFKNYTEILFEIAVDRNLPVRSPLLRPSSSHTKFLSTIRMLLVDNLRLNQMGRIRRFSRNLEEFLENADKKPAMPDWTDARAYGPAINLGKDLKDASASASKKRILIREELKRLTTRNRTVEFVFHLIDDHYPNLKKHKRAMRRKKSNYTGVSTLYFDGRLAEHLMFKRLRLPDGVKMTTWKNL